VTVKPTPKKSTAQHFGKMAGLVLNSTAKVEFGSKLQVAMVLGFTFIDHLSWEAFNESEFLAHTIEKYKEVM